MITSILIHQALGAVLAFASLAPAQPALTQVAPAPPPAAIPQAAPAPQPAPAPSPAPPAAQPAARPNPPRPVPLEVRLTITRKQGAKLLSSRPYVLAVAAGAGNSQLNLGNEVPIASSSFAPAGDPKTTPQPLRSYNYRSVGTSIEVSATQAADVFDLSINIDDTAVATGTGAAADLPTMRSYRSRNRVALKPGESREYTTATDSLTGESVTVAVELELAKVGK